MKPLKMPQLLAATALVTCSLSSHAIEWSSNTISTRIGNTFAEPGIAGASIKKNIYSFTHVSGDKLGRNLVVADVVISGDNDPSAGGGGGAQEFYGVYRRAFSLTKVTGKEMSFGPVKDVNLVGRADLQTKNTRFAPRSRKNMGGLSLEFAVPKGFVESGVYAFSETNHNGILGKDVSYSATYQIDTSWMIPFNVGIPAQWRGTFVHTGAKGKDAFNVETAAETRLLTSVMFEVGNKTGLQMGLGYEIWRNKYGNDASKTIGAKQNTAMLMAEYQF